MLFLDFETRSEESLSDTNAWTYSRHKTTDVICMAYAFNQDPVKLWIPGEPLPEVFKHNPGLMLCAHNVLFEHAIYNNVMVEKYGATKTGWIEWICTMNMARCVGLPGSLEGAASALKLGHKMEKGVELIKRFSQPFRKNGSVSWYAPTKFELEEFYEYCKNDVELTRGVYYKLKDNCNVQLEDRIQAVDRWQNVTGVPVNKKVLGRVCELIDEARRTAEARAEQLGVSPRSGPSMIKFCKERGVDIPDVREDTIVEHMAVVKDEEVLEAMKLRLFLSRSSVKKFDMMYATTDADGRCRHLLSYYGAHTGRWAGRGFQPHNLPKTGVGAEDSKQMIDDFLARKFDVFDTMEIAKKILPAMIQAEEYKTFMLGDFAAIEARVLAYIAGEQELIELFRSDKLVYETMASKIYNKPVKDIIKQERQLGKVAILGCGYGMGGNRFVAACKNFGIDINTELAEHTVKTYREEHPMIKNFWYEIQAAVGQAIDRPGNVRTVRGLEILVTGTTLTIKLPSGRKLYYHRVKKNKDGKIERKDLRSGAVESLYYGNITENIVQAIARDILVDRMIKCIDSGLSPILHVHDEIICYEDKKSIEIKAAVFEGIMNEAPVWLPGFPLKTEIEVCEVYHK